MSFGWKGIGFAAALWVGVLSSPANAFRAWQEVAALRDIPCRVYESHSIPVIHTVPQRTRGVIIGRLHETTADGWYVVLFSDVSICAVYEDEIG